MLGHNQVKFRTTAQALVQQACEVYPSSKVVHMLQAGFVSKNKRSRAECVTSVGMKQYPGVVGVVVGVGMVGVVVGSSGRE